MSDDRPTVLICVLGFVCALVACDVFLFLDTATPVEGSAAAAQEAFKPDERDDARPVLGARLLGEEARDPDASVPASGRDPKPIDGSRPETPDD